MPVLLLATGSVAAPILTMTTKPGLIVSVNAAPPVQWYINGVPVPVTLPDVSLTLAPGQVISVNGVNRTS